MRIGVPRESREGQRLVAATPATVAKLRKLGYDVVIEHDAGAAANFSDAAYVEAGATTAPTAEVWGSDVVVAVDAPDAGRLDLLKPGAVLVAQLFPGANPDAVQAYADRQVTAMALDAVPRISRAQALDTLSTMSNVSGYRAVIEAAAEFQGMFTGQVTAAGKTPPATVFVIGGGVAGLAAIGTASSLGADVRAFDVRPEAGEQIESMGATFVQAEAAQQEVSSDGYARELTADQEAATARMYAQETARADIVITTALVRGKAPRTITNEMIAAMKPGSVIVDLAASGGGNAEATVPGERAVTENGVVVLGYTDLPGRMPAQTSQLYGTNIVNLLTLLTPGKDGTLVLDLEDPVQRGMTVTRSGETLWPPPPVQVSAAPAADLGAGPTPAAQTAALAATAADAAAKAQLRRRRLTFGGALAAVLVILGLTYGPPSFLGHFTVFALSVVIGFYVISNVSHSLHTPLMAQTNAISGIILVGAMLQLGNANLAVTILAFVAATVASINIFGGFLVSRRMIAMFRKDA
ncbi:NAD(P) transhydrogenase, alpha subunit [Xylanimonas cellulosilytica DSM 15894]|uniref:proton-translocating NAD(P)(+) transhydrogenase n=1 Tax=Xylanimonas cellulosilytica (strain DSM 15894 / JCM 12276 / CECT 5975 / KCTC 9989 / LMG 20990 / NBRC 107835 / XIL07) TaxID=446471 RepID=D1BV25_XYLCX|nr:Re/Si-specific NAD(P)(+) transhydrogenase subunit alpha [Xylanimonas cellulosilytica]ACZ31264.1 NAD(P) transhydrogenase, alpha subunit [Xylanimonas cellulosilytica DSM 15894]